MLEVLVDSHLRIRESDLSPAMAEQIGLRFSYPNPEPLPPSARESEAPWTRPNWEAVQRRDGWLCLPRGLTDALRNIASGCGESLKFVDRMTWDRSRSRVAPSDLAVKLRPYQEEAVKAMVDRVQGYIVLPCGGGKTTVGVTTILHLNQSSIILVGSTDLLEQWDAAIIRCSAGLTRPRLIGAGNRGGLKPLAPGEVAVAMVQALADRPGVQAFLDSAGLALTDEVHHVVARTWAQLVDNCPARWRLGLSATPDRSDGWGFVLRVMLGQQLFQRASKDLVRDGYLQRPTVIPVRSEWEPRESEYRWKLTCPTCGQSDTYGFRSWQAGKAACTGRRRTVGARGGVRVERCGLPLPPDCVAVKGDMDWSVASTSLHRDENRQHLLTTLAGKAAAAGRRVLVLVGRKEGLQGLVDSIRQYGVNAEAVSSQTAARDSRIRDFRSGKLDVLVATSLADEGLDVPELDCVVLGQPGKDPGKAKQRSGRTTRPQGGKAVVFDVVDRGDTLARHWQRRKAAYLDEYGPDCLGAPRPVSVEEALDILRRL